MQSRHVRRIHLIQAVAVLAVAIVLACQTYAVSRVAARPTAVATVNLEKVFDGLEERASAERELVELAEDLQEKNEKRAEEIQMLSEEIEAYTPGSDKHQEALEKFELQSLNYQADVEFARRKLEVEQGLVLIRIYREMKQAARAIAEEEGFDVIFVDDSVAELVSGPKAEVHRQISARRMLYANPEIDLSDVLMERMNKDFTARAGAAGSGARSAQGPASRP